MLATQGRTRDAAKRPFGEGVDVDLHLPIEPPFHVGDDVEGIRRRVEVQKSIGEVLAEVFVARVAVLGFVETHRRQQGPEPLQGDAAADR